MCVYVCVCRANTEILFIILQCFKSSENCLKNL